jgi:RNA polymerase sigma-70 factor, ECF subfamily
MASSKHRSSDGVTLENPINKFAAHLIRRKARELSTRAGFSPTDRDDIEQELRLILLRRLDKFDPSVAHYNAFVTTVVERYSATILEHRQAESRSHSRYGGSLNQLVDDGDGNKIEMGATLPEDQQSVRTGARFRSGEELHDLATDVAQLIADLPPEVADICERLKRDTISVVARDLGMPRSTLRDLLKGVRSRFESCDMREYL